MTAREEAMQEVINAVARAESEHKVALDAGIPYCIYCGAKKGPMAEKIDHTPGCTVMKARALATD